MSTLFGFISTIPSLVVFIACCYYISKQVKAASILLFIGSGLSLVLSAFYRFLMPYLMQSSGLSISETSTYYSVASVIGFVDGICFAVGLFILINNTVNANKSLPNQFPPNDFK